MHQALVIGVDRYSRQPNTNLQCAARDAEAVSKRFAEAGFNVVSLVNEDATLEQIIRALETDLNARITEENEIVAVYWAGHGYSVPESLGSDSGWGTFLLPSDGIVTKPIESALPVSTLWALLSQLRTRRLVVFLDTCFSGAAAGDGRTLPFPGANTRGEVEMAPLTSGFIRSIGGEGRVVICACGPREVAREDTHGSRHGFFTKVLLDALDGQVPDPDNVDGVRISLLSDYIRTQVPRRTGLKQTPYVHHTSSGQDFVFPTPPRMRAEKMPVPTWSFAGTAGGVGKTTLAMLTAELLAEAGHNVLYLDIDIAHMGGTNSWLQRAGAQVARSKTFADHVADHTQNQAQNPALAAITSGPLSARPIDVTPAYLRRNHCGRILLIGAVRPTEPVFAFALIASIANDRSNDDCRQILDDCLARGFNYGIDCMVIDCSAQFDNVSVNAMHAAHHPFIVGTAVAGSKQIRDNMLANCRQLVPEFDWLSVQTVVNRVPSTAALNYHWGELNRGYRYLENDPQLFIDWHLGRPNFELGYDDLSKIWHEILVESDRMACSGLHRNFLPQEWDRFSKWALWVSDHPDWPSERARVLRGPFIRRLTAAVSLVAAFVVCTGLLVYGNLSGQNSSALNGALAIGDLLAAPFGFYFGLAASSYRRRLRLLRHMASHGSDRAWLYDWFTAKVPEAPWWHIWRRSRRATIKWFHDQVDQARRGK